MGLLLYNWFGYRALYHVLQARADDRMERQLDRHEYDDRDLVEVRIPLHLPYISPSSDFQRCEGQVDIEGRHYAYVKRKVQNDSLVLLCIPFDARKKISDARNGFFGMVNGLASEHPQKTPLPFFKNLLTEYAPEQNDWSLSGASPVATVFTGHYLLLIPAPLRVLPERPPEVA